MKLTFVSNYINHHQIPLSNALFQRLGAEYTFIQTEPVESARLEMKWEDLSEQIPYVRCSYQEPELCRRLIMESDLVIFGGTDDENYITERLQAKKPVFRYSERIYKTGQWKAISPRGLVRKYHDHIRYRKDEVYMLCSGGYVASDFHLIGAYPDKMFKWGYFPETKHLDVDNLMESKTGKGITPIKILWAGRFLDWKHPELAVRLAQVLKQEGWNFQLEIIGGGEMQGQLQQEIREKGLMDVITCSGYQPPEKVREAMEKSRIFLFTSDYQEGWGVVLNEAMNSGCAVVASHAIGAVPFLLQHRENGLIFRSRDLEDLVRQTRWLLEEQSRIELLGRNACHTILETWNAEHAAAALLELADGLLDSGKIILQQDGPCSRAEAVSPGRMYRYLVKE